MPINDEFVLTSLGILLHVAVSNILQASALEKLFVRI